MGFISKTWLSISFTFILVISQVLFGSNLASIHFGMDYDNSLSPQSNNQQKANYLLQTIKLISVSSSGIQGNGSSTNPSISSDGRFIAFESIANNLVSDDTNNTVDIFVRDTKMGTTERVSISSIGEEANDASSNPSISGDGRFVAFISTADNLIETDTNTNRWYYEIFVHDRKDKTTKVVSVSSEGIQGNQSSGHPSISADGRFIAFESSSNNLISNDTNGHGDIFVHDLQTGITERVSLTNTGLQSGGTSIRPSISGNGQFIAFTSASSDLVPGTHGGEDIFVRDRINNTTELVSIASNGEPGDGFSYNPQISENGRFVVFDSYASNLGDIDDDFKKDIFIHDRQTGITELISISSEGVQGNNVSTDYSCVSNDGRFVTFYSFATNLTPEGNRSQSIFLRDRNNRTTELVSASIDGADANGVSIRPCISSDGHFVIFDSSASNLTENDTSASGDVFTYEVANAITPPLIDLSINSVIPVQVIEGQDLVRDKATAVKVEVTKIGPDPVNDVQVSLTIGSNLYNTFYVADPDNMKKENNYILEKDQTGFPLNFSIGDDTKTIYFIEPGLKASGSTFNASAYVDLQKDIPETDETNNLGEVINIPVYDTNWGENNPNLELKYFLIDREITSEYPISSILSDFHKFTNHQDNFIKGVFPVSNNRYHPDEDDNFIYSTSSYRGDDERLGILELWEFIYSGLPPIILAEQSKDNYIGVVPKNWFEDSTDLDGWGAHFYLSPIMIVEERIAKKIDPDNPNTCSNPDDCIFPNGLSVVAHELGHSYGLWRSFGFTCEEYQLCNIFRDNAVGNYAAPGLWVNERIPIMDITDREIYCFMSGRGGVERWVDEKDYNDLFTDHYIPNVSITNTSIEPPGTILAIGVINNSDLVILENWYSLTESDVDQLPPGPYSFVYLNNLGEVINQVPFDVVFEIDNGNDNIPVESIPFVLRIPNYPDTASIEIRNNGTILAEKVISQNAPEVKILSPNGGEVYDKTITFTWEGSDADGDELYYTVLLSDDNGISWTPIAGNLNSTQLEWEIEHFGAGSSYKIKVIATDGFNTGEDLSDQTFSILGRLFLPLSVR